ncbi:MAG TPA: hypothetical protein VFJ11_04000 [Gaiellaceae bacterium]|nr:hypothetical protein [Gaiellaceae bacterium]
MDDAVAAGREIVVGSVLILIRSSLIAFTGALVVIRPRLILVTRGLVAIRPRLILVALGLIAIEPRAVTGRTDGACCREVDAAGRTGGTLGYLAAGWTPHDLRHHCPFPSQES